MKRNTLIPVASTCCVCVLLAGCGQSDQAERYPMFPWRFVRIAELETDHPSALVGNLEYDSAAIGPDGTVFVATDSWKGVHVFDRTGKWIRNLGGEGHGPGEFQLVRSVATSPTGRLALYDDIGRVSVFEADGVFSHTFRYMINSLSPIRIGCAGSAGFWTMNTAITNPDPSAPGVREDLITLSSEGDTLSIYPIPDSIPELVIGRLSSANPAVGAPKWTVSPDGSAWLFTPGGGHLVHISPAGGQADSIAVHVYPPVFTDDEWARIIEAETAVLREVDFLNEYVEPTIEALVAIRDRWNPVQRLWWIDENGLLVDRMTPAYPSVQRGPWKYAALDFDGFMTGEVEGPAGLLTAAYGFALTVSSEWLELPEITLWRLEPIQR